jgi:hypothetical protein
MIARREKAITQRKSRPRPQTINLWDWVKQEPDPSNADEAVLILGIACCDPRWIDKPAGDRERLLLEPWAVKAALSRRATRKLDGKELDEARRCTRDARTLRWPDPVET